jgi:hypothetical protein
MDRIYRRAIMAGAVLALTACGGGGGGGSSEITIDGAAVKGVIRNADVLVFELGAKSLNAVDGKQIGSGATGPGGAFNNLKITDYQGGAVLLQVKGRATGTEVRCDAPAAQVAKVCGAGKSRGDFIAVGPDFLLESYLPKLSNGSNSLNVSALTHLLGGLAKLKLATLNTSQALAQAQSQVRSLAGGVDVVGTAPVDLLSVPANATGQQLAYSALNAAVLSLADSTATTPQAAIASAVKNLADDFADGSIKKGKLADLVAVAKAQLDAAGKADSAGVLASLDAASQGDPASDFKPEPIADNAGTAVSAAKAFTGNLRNTVQRYEDVLRPDQASNTYLAGLEEAAGLAEPKALALFESLGLVVDAAGELIDSANASGTKTLSTQGTGGAKSATITKSSTGGVTTITAVGSVRNDTVNLTFKLPTDKDQAKGATLTVSLEGSAETVGDSGAKLTIASASKGVVTLRDASKPILSNDEIQNDFTAQNIKQVVFDLDATLAQKGSKTLSFQGVIGATVVRCEASGNVCSTPAGDVAAFAPTRLSVKGVVKDGTNNEVNANIGVTIADASAKNFNYSQPYSATNFLQGTVTISSKVKLPASVAPETTVTVAIDSKGWNNARQAPVGSVTINFTEGSTALLSVSGENTAQKVDITTVKISGNGGVLLTLVNKAANPAEDVDVGGSILTVNGVKAAEVRQNGGLVTLHYVDGTFETLFN